jgi:hypothetical protein
MMFMDYPFPVVHRVLEATFAQGGAERVEVERWHAQDIRGNKMLVSQELRNVVFQCEMPKTPQEAVDLVEPQMPWAEDHFGERVSGDPLNPPPSAERWLGGAQADKHRTIDEGGERVYSHTYPERFWPRKAGEVGRDPQFHGHMGIRFDYGDLRDVVNQLAREPLTRQAYLPVWFPEDTGAVHKERVPCTLGYHFMIRQDRLNITYLIRSVDFIRHFRDDVYLAMRLAQWMVDQLRPAYMPDLEPTIGHLTMHIMSLHAFEGDMAKLRREHGTD